MTIKCKNKIPQLEINKEYFIYYIKYNTNKQLQYGIKVMSNDPFITFFDASLFVFVNSNIRNDWDFSYENELDLMTMSFKGLTGLDKLNLILEMDSEIWRVIEKYERKMKIEELINKISLYDFNFKLEVKHIHILKEFINDKNNWKIVDQNNWQNLKDLLEFTSKDSYAEESTLDAFSTALAEIKPQLRTILDFGN